MQAVLGISRSYRTFVVAAAWLGIATTSSLQAEITYFVDPDWNGATTGAPSTPWTALDSAEWNVINNALASDDVAVYFSAREATTNTNETTTARIQILRTNTSSNHLTLDGMSRFNNNDSNPTWVNYSGPRRFQITAPVPISTANTSSPFPARRNYTVRGFVVRGSIKVLDIAHSINATLEYNDVAAQVGATNGPALHVDNWAATNNGALWSDGLVIRNNLVHDTYGEAIYINGHKTQASEGNPSSSNVLIEGNTVFNAGSRGHQGDGIDIKDGVLNLIVRGNYIFDCGHDGIVTDSGGLYEGNYVYDNDNAGLAMATIEANLPNRTDSEVRNNIIIGNQHGISVRGPGNDPDDWRNLTLANNTIAFHAGDGIAIDPNNQTNPTVNVRNNILWENGNRQLYVNQSPMLLAHTNNLYGNTSGDFLVRVGGVNWNAAGITNFEASALSADPQFQSPSTSSPMNFKPRSTSPVIGAATPMGSFVTDFFEFARGPGSAWEIGAVEFDGSGDAPPAPPTGLHEIPQP